MNLTELFQSKKFKGVLYVVGIAFLALLVFRAGVFVGYRKAGFAYRLGDNYYRTFGGHMGMREEEFTSAHGAIGKIIKISLPTLFIEDQDNVEKLILIKDSTAIRKFREEIKSSDLKIDDSIIIIGSPNDKSEIEAKLIRILPYPPDFLKKK